MAAPASGKMGVSLVRATRSQPFGKAFRTAALEPIKQGIKRNAPWVLRGVRAARWARNQVSFPVVATAVELRAAGRVMSGPFAGMRLPGTGMGQAFYTQLLGTYERALAPVIETVIARAPSTIIDAGACSGYYAIGLALRCPDSRIIAYEIDGTRADVMRKYETRNGLSRRLEVRGECTTAALAHDLAHAADPFLLMDVEGAEDRLLDPSRVPGLRHTEMLIELHEEFVSGITERVCARFDSTHDQTLLYGEPISIDPELMGWVADQPLLRPVALRLLDEGRETNGCWLHLVPRPTR